MIGSTVSHYRVLRSIGVGGMGIVYLAEDTRLSRKVALKFLPPIIAQEPSARARFLREAQAASALDHPNVATIYEIGDWERQLFIAMAFYEGETLRERLERGPLAVPEAAAILGQLSTGLAAAHRAGIVHRDLKPANIMLTRDGQVKILDFGLAKIMSDSARTATHLTNPGTVMGTVAYMSPEQAQGAEVDARADVWAVGVMAYEMFAGRLPFNAENPTAALLSLVTDTPPALGAVRPDIPHELASVVERALEKSPEHRTVTAEAVVAAVSTWQARSSAPSAGSGRIPSVSGRWIAASALLLLAIAVALGWFVRQGSQARWAREQALPEIERLVEQEQYVAAFGLANEAKRYIGTDPIWNRLDPIISRPLSVITSPPGSVDLACLRLTVDFAIEVGTLSPVEIRVLLIRMGAARALGAGALLEDSTRPYLMETSVPVLEQAGLSMTSPAAADTYREVAGELLAATRGREISAHGRPLRG